jgi:hypothetical protein
VSDSASATASAQLEEFLNLEHVVTAPDVSDDENLEARSFAINFLEELEEEGQMQPNKLL